MKRIVLLSGMFVAAVLCGCTDDVVDNGNKIVDNPVKEGSEILFGSSLSGDADEEVSAQSKVGTRTVYGERTNTGVPVYWKPEGDEVAIFCSQTSQPADHLVNYLVKPQVGEEYQHLSASVEKLEDVGLQWGTSDEHRFYAFYPASAVKGSVEEDQTGKITANIPVTQQPTSWEEGELNGVKTYFGLPNMDYAYMYAYTSQKRSETPEGTAIDLQFKNLVTVLDITVQGPESGDPITVSNINITAVDGKNIILTGDFTCYIRGAQDNSEEVTAECEAAGNLQEVRNNVSIPCYNLQTDEFIKLEPNEQLNVKAYIIPDDDESHKITPQQLQITVATLNGAAKRKVLQTADVVPHKINRVRLPHLEAGGTNYWMSNLDPDIYVTELSIPGSKFSFLTSDNNSDVEYQATTTEQQFLNGVRAFHVQTAADYSYRTTTDVTNPDRYTEKDLYIAVGTEVLRAQPGNIFDAIFGTGDPIPLRTFLQELKKNLDDARSAGKTNEFAVVNLTYSRAATEELLRGLYPLSNKETGWIVTVCNMLKKYVEEDGLPIYTGEITPNTTIKDVAGQIIVHVNINTPSLANRMTEAIDYPAIFSWWDSEPNGYVEGGTPLRWGTPVKLEETSNMTWLYQELTDVDQSVGKWTQITALLDAAKSDYEAGAHSTWYYNDIGGYFGSPSTDNVKALSAVYVPKMIRELQERNVNYSLGTMLTNFADGEQGYGLTSTYNTRELIQTIIDNNFKFALRTSGSSSQSTYNAAYSKGGNAIGWDK